MKQILQQFRLSLLSSNQFILSNRLNLSRCYRQNFSRHWPQSRSPQTKVKQLSTDLKECKRAKRTAEEARAVAEEKAIAAGKGSADAGDVVGDLKTAATSTPAVGEGADKKTDANAENENNASKTNARKNGEENNTNNGDKHNDDDKENLKEKTETNEHLHTKIGGLEEELRAVQDRLHDAESRETAYQEQIRLLKLEWEIRGEKEYELLPRG
jgi:hypothetical protein